MSPVGSPRGVGRLPVEAQRARFLSKVVKTSADSGSCWLWTGKRNEKGYGVVQVDGARRYAHQRAYALFVGPIPDGHEIRHACDVRHCVRPEHLSTGTHQENMDDMRERRRARLADSTHCKNGHEFTPENTYHSTERGRQRRGCRACRKAAVRRNEGYTGQGRWPARHGGSADGQSR